MQKQFILSYLAADKPGLVDQLSRVVASCGANWQTSRMANLEGTFTGVIHLSIGTEQAPMLNQALEQLESDDIWLRLVEAHSHSHKPSRSIKIRVQGTDRTGIVSQVAERLARLEVNVEELSTSMSPAPMSGGFMFEADALVSAPAELSLGDLRNALEELADDLMIDLDAL